MSTAWILFKCLPFFGFGGIGVYLLLVGFFPSWREPGWRHWKVHGSDNDSPHYLSRALGFSKASKPLAEGDWPEATARRFYLCVGFAIILLAFVGIRHFAGIPQSIPDILERLPT
jgi:hypothetical protein